MLAQIKPMENEADQAVAEYLAQLSAEDFGKLEDLLHAHIPSQETMLAQVGQEDEQMFAKVAQYLSQLSAQQVDNMGQYLMQLETVKTTGDESLLAQQIDGVDENMAAVADYLVQLDQNELAQVTAHINSNATM